MTYIDFYLLHIVTYVMYMARCFLHVIYEPIHCFAPVHFYKYDLYLLYIL
jgi:hypothetical protein